MGEWSSSPVEGVDGKGWELTDESALNETQPAASRGFSLMINASARASRRSLSRRNRLRSRIRVCRQQQHRNDRRISAEHDRCIGRND